ncbi:Phospho-N-acetylmuramoyl-pentapeptide-transferase [Propionispira arboris]|uniref:Phospho-N-acetylmuramoyl-pentapeptide-transferase n=1 Tax=Propionispira arboris TaxID=84035 RepID=A0A1H7ADQ3_9FIRM|nr:phospho-N-acetylmuramoyl-pentapeptide-transferase [Propionispira arboris]SEJ63731.1 Phospho-N-acetylmuramoyl-pentapeptide-transferase [Propionispira arboris]
MSVLFYPTLVALLIVLISGPVLIPILHKMKFGQSIRQEGPKSHQAKTGTPTMGGLMIMIAIVISTCFFAKLNMEVCLALFVMLGHCFIGFLDDYIKVVLKRNLGLKAKQKLFGQIVMALIVTYVGVNYMGMKTDLWIPFSGITFDLGILYYFLVFFVLVGTTNAVNLTDGLDGLAAGTMTIAILAYALICLRFGKTDLAIFCLAVAGATIGFLWFNVHPAKVFMGDTGSLALGGALAAVAILTKTEILLAIVGFVFVIEALSVIIQVISFKTRGKRVFLMSPIHHHFELKGWSETKVVGVFWLVGLICSVAALLILKVS